MIDAKNSRPLPKQIQRLRQTSTDSTSSENSNRGRTASVRLISSTSSNLSDLPEDLVVGNDDVVDESENLVTETDNFEGIFGDSKPLKIGPTLKFTPRQNKILNIAYIRSKSIYFTIMTFNLNLPLRKRLYLGP